LKITKNGFGETIVFGSRNLFFWFTKPTHDLPKMEKLLKKKSFGGLSNSNLFGFAGVENSKIGPTLTLLT
jgi:hypothetical protein